jgi:signal transduction histidine kinase
MGIASLLWALRVTDGVRGTLRRWRDRAGELEEKLARTDSVFAAFPGLVIIWEDDSPPGDDHDWGKPRLYGSIVALQGLLRFSDNAEAEDVAVRILQGLSVFDATDATGERRRLGPVLARLRREGAPFSLKIATSEGVVVEVDGRTAGARAVLWVSDPGAKGVEQGGAQEWAGLRQTLTQNPTLFLEIMARLPMPAWLLTGAGKLDWANGAYLTALDAKSLEQATLRNLLLDQGVTEQARKTIELGAENEDLRHVVIGGARRAMRIIMFPVAGGVAGVALDVTQAEDTRETIARQSRAYDDTLNHLAEGVAIFGPDKKLIFHNSAFATMWGLDASFLAERPTHAAWLDHLKERRKLPAHANYAEWRAGELAMYQEAGDLPEALWHLPGERTLRVARQRHPLGGLLLIFSDRTDELTLKSQYQSLLQVQRAALDRLHEGVIVLGLDGRLQLSNSAFAGMWDLQPSQLEGAIDFDRIVDLCLPLFHDRSIWTQIKARVTDPSPQARQEFSGEMRRSDDKIVQFLTRPLPDGATLIAFLDATASRKVEEALRDRAAAFEEADNLKTDFVQNISYQLRTPLQTIQGYAEVLGQRLNGPLNERQQEHIGIVLDASRKLSQLIDNVLDIAMVDAGRAELELSDVDLRAALMESVELSSSNLRSVDVNLRIDCAKDIGVLRADEKRIKQILFHLLSNAMRFTDKGGEIVAGITRTADEVRLSVSDTGAGIAYDLQAGAFDNFVSGDHRGAGLGLALVRKFVEMHGGWVTLQSAPGEGTTVTCRLPVHMSVVPLGEAARISA